MTRFPASEAIAARIASYLARHMAIARAQGVHDLAVLPPVSHIARVVDSAFWASLRREEGYSPRISLALTSAAFCDAPLLFERPLDLSPVALAHLAPAVERPGVHLGVWSVGDCLHMWGTTRGIPAFCVVVEVVAPGVLVFKHRHVDDTVKYVNMAVLDGDEVKVVEETIDDPASIPRIVAFLEGFHSSTSQRTLDNVLVQLAVSMRAHGRGGILLIVPGDGDWRASIAGPVPYAVQPAYTVLADVVRHGTPGGDSRASDEFERLAVEHIGGLTAVDGATVLNDSYDVLAFGAKIIRRDGSDQVDQVLMTEPIEGRTPRLLNPAQVGGTRHLSAVQFVYDQPDALALVASQDGRFTVFEWSKHRRVVHGHRVDTLLL